MRIFFIATVRKSVSPLLFNMMNRTGKWSDVSQAISHHIDPGCAVRIGERQSCKIRNKIPIIIIFFVTVLELCSCQKQPKLTFYVNPSSSNIEVLLREGNYEEALNIYTKQLEDVLEDSNEAAGIYLSIGDLYTSYIKDREKAIQYLEKAIEIDQKNQNELALADDYYVMSDVYVGMGGSTEEGIEYAEKAEELYKKHVGKDSVEVADTQLNRGMLYYKAEELEKALENFEAAQNTYESIHEETGYTCIYIGKTLLRLKEYDRAEKALVKAKQLCERSGRKDYSASAEFYLGRLYLEKKDWEKAINNFKKAVDFYEDDTRYLNEAALAFENLAYCVEMESGKWEEGMPYLIKACQSMEGIDSLTEEKKSIKETLKQMLRMHYDKWRPDAEDQDYKIWYQKAVLDGEGWEKETEEYVEE